jgi:hypothetical protein
VEAIKALGRTTIAKHSTFGCPHYYAAGLQACLLVVAVDAVCECRGYKGGYEKDKSNNYHQEEH